MSEPLLTVQAKGFLAGFGALYAIFLGGCVTLFVAVLVFMPSGEEQLIFLGIFASVFILLICYAIKLRAKENRIFKAEWTFVNQNEYYVLKDGQEQKQIEADRAISPQKIPPKMR